METAGMFGKMSRNEICGRNCVEYTETKYEMFG